MLRPAFAALLLALPLFAQAAAVRQFSPQGQIDQQIRASARFTDDMVPLGQPDALAPFDVDCGGVAGKGRWSDSKSWTYVLDRPLKPGERCDFRLKPGLKAGNGDAVRSESSYAFFAPGPWPRSLMPRPGDRIEEDQVFLVEASGVLKRESVEKYVWCEADGVGNRIPVRLLSDKDRDAALATVHRSAQPGSLGLACTTALPAGARMKLVWGKGVEAESGAKATREESFLYTVREPFRASFSCERERANQPCSPLSDLRLEFSAQLERKVLDKIRLVTPEGTRTPTPDDQGSRQNTGSGVVFPKPFPQNAELRLEIPADVRDEAGRPLSNAGSFPLKVKTGTLPPLAKFPGDFGILELKEGGILPVTLRNVETALPTRNLQLPAHRFADQRLTDDADVLAAMRALAKFEQQTKTTRSGSGKDAVETFDPWVARELPFLKDRRGVVSRDLPKPGAGQEFEVMGIPLEKPGYHIVEIESRLLGAALLATPKPMYVRTAVLVTNLGVHLKTGRDNGLVWVTALDSGKPVAGAEVRVSRCDGSELWRGRTDDQGRALIERGLRDEQGCESDFFLLASARLGDDYSFVRSDWQEGIEPWRFGVETWGEATPRKIHSILDRPLFRTGETVSLKHIARDRNSRGFATPDAKGLPTEMLIRHDGSGDEFRQPVSWDARGTATNTWKIPAAAKRGRYIVMLIGGDRNREESGEFRVSDFRLPVFAGSIQGVPPRQVAPKEVPLALGLSFLNGGAAKGVETEVSATLRPRWPEFKGFEAFRFQVDFDQEGLGAFAVDNGRESEQLISDKVPVTLDKAGAGKLSVTLPERVKGPSEVYAEMTFPDPNGEIQTIHGTVELWPAAVTAGIRVKDWVAAKGEGGVEVAVLDTASKKPLADVAVKILAKRRIDYSHRKRVVGGFYAYEHHTEFSDLGELCAGRTDSRGLLLCAPKVDVAGNVYLLAEARDAQGNVARAGTSYWVAGAGDTWFTAGNQDRIDVIPEKRSYAPGEKARLQVRMPFREATALVSVEADGIIDTFVQPLSRYKPTIDLPVKSEWGPNVFVSVLAVRGRVQPVKWYSFFDWGWREPLAWFKEWWNPTQPTAMVDLAKPAYKVGLAALDVGIDGFRLKVDVAPEKADYRPRDTAKVRVKVTQPDGKPVPAGTEVALAAVDQALLELRPNESWKLLEAMLPRRGYEVQTATAQSQVIGKRHFGKKAVPPGGGGGRAPARELFDTLLLWNPRVALDDTGSATIAVPINDSLSEFKVVAVAAAGTSLFGTGSGGFRTKQDLQMISGLPPLVREKDRFAALLTLRNGTAKPMTVHVTAKTGGKALEAKDVKLEAEGAAEVAWNAEAPDNVAALDWEFEAADSASGAKDRLKITQQVAPAVPVTVQQATFARIEGKLELPAVLAANALPGRGGIEVGLSPRISTPPPGLKRFFEEYPFICLEQKTSIAVGLRDEKRWQQIVEALPTYLDGNGLARYFPSDMPGSPSLTAYLLDVSQAAGFVIPPEIAGRMEKGLLAFAEGRIKPEHWAPTNDLTARKLSALEALTRRGHKPLGVITSLDLEQPMRLPTAALIDWHLVARRLTELPDRAPRLAAAEQEIRNRLSYQGGRLAFTTEASDYWWWLMVSGDYNVFRLIEAVIDEPGWKDDLPALVQGAMLRQVRGRWVTTTANVWATIALDAFGKKFEKDPVAGTTRAVLGKGTPVSHAWSAGDTATLALPWPAKPAADDKLAISHEGSGKPWASVQVLAAVPVNAPRALGYRIKREVTPVTQKVAGKTSRGDVLRIRINVEADQDMAWVVLNDPIPAGARILGDGDGRDSHIESRNDGTRGNAWPAYVERTFSAYRAYYARVAKGNFSVEYTVRLNNAGDFALPATRVEAMYAPEVFGEVPGGRITVEKE
ncbi:MAG: alpha-2-macroglobulin [Dechloromonas sp.]|nr:alpha-2-macroglobulin [Dechloromonas sp.]